MKNLNKLMLAGLIVALIGCNPAEESTGYKISLTIDNAPDSTMVSLYKRLDDGEEVIDSILLIDGKATIIGKMEGQPEEYYVRLNGQRGVIPLFLENSPINIQAHIDSLRKAKVSGSILNDKYASLKDKQAELRKKMQPLYPAYQKAQEEGDKAKLAEIDSVYEVLQSEMDHLGEDFIGQNSDNILGPYLASRIYYYDDYLTQLDSILKTFDPSLNGSKYITSLQERVDKWSKLKIGMTAPDFSQADSLGNQLSLSSLRGKYLLIDFWASWCGPCRRENPNIVAAYKTYHDKGFDILGVSLDDNRDKWIKAIAKDGLTWNHVSDLKGWGNVVSNEYGIRAIPYSLLIDADGVIIGKNLRGEKLQEALAEALD